MKEIIIECYLISFLIFILFLIVSNCGYGHIISAGVGVMLGLLFGLFMLDYQEYK